MDRTGGSGSARGLRRGRGRRATLNRGAIYDADLPGRRRPAVIVARDRAIPFLANVTVAAITRSIRGLPTEVLVGQKEGLVRESVVNCDNLFTIPKSSLGARRGALGPEGLEQLRDALRIALGLD